MTLKIISGCRPFQVQSVDHLCSIWPDFNWHRARAVPQRQLGFLSPSVKLRGWTTISGKMLACGFCKITLTSCINVFWNFSNNFENNQSITCRRIILERYYRRPGINKVKCRLQAVYINVRNRYEWIQLQTTNQNACKKKSAKHSEDPVHVLESYVCHYVVCARWKWSHKSKNSK